MNFLTLDLATRIGFTLGPLPERRFAIGSHILPSTQDDIGGFLDAYLGWLRHMISEHDVYYIAFEMPILPKVTSLATLRKLYGLCGLTELVALRANRLKCREANLGAVRKFMCGNAFAKKHRVVEMVEHYGYKVDDDDQADAVALRLYAISRERPELLRAWGMDLGPLGMSAA